MNLCLKACPMRSRSSLENLPSGYVRLTKSPQMRSMSSSLMLWSSAMGSGQSGSGCRNASAMPSTSVRPSRWEIHRRATRGSVRCGGRAASHSDVGMPSARHCGVVMLLVGLASAEGDAIRRTRPPAHSPRGSPSRSAFRRTVKAFERSQTPRGHSSHRIPVERQSRVYPFAPVKSL
jgi:hypothetical protein